MPPAPAGAVCASQHAASFAPAEFHIKPLAPPDPRRLFGHACARAPAAPDDPFRFRPDVRIYVAGALFSEAERAWLDGLAARVRGEGFECFVPHEQFGELT